MLTDRCVPLRMVRYIRSWLCCARVSGGTSQASVDSLEDSYLRCELPAGGQEAGGKKTESIWKICPWEKVREPLKPINKL